MVVRRPGTNLRESVQEAQLDILEGLIGDNWRERGSSRTPDGSANPEAQLTIMNSRAIELIANSRDRWSLAGDQIYLDMDLSMENLPPGTRLRIGEAIIVITTEPHTGCAKFKKRFGGDALEFVNSTQGRAQRLRGANARIIQNGIVRVGDTARRLSA